MLYIPFPFKRCRACGNYLLPTTRFFYRNRKLKDGLCYLCRKCGNQRAQDWSKANPDKTKKWKTSPKRKEARKRYRAENAENIRETARRYRQAHKPQKAALQRRYTARNKETVRQRDKRYRQNHRESLRNYFHNYRARRKLLPATFTDSDWQKALDWWHGVCAYCGNPPQLWDKPRVLHQDHFVPVKSGGGYIPENILPACKYCNSGKCDSDASRWLNKKYGTRKATRILKKIAEYFEWVRNR